MLGALPASASSTEYTTHPVQATTMPRTFKHVACSKRSITAKQVAMMGCAGCHIAAVLEPASFTPMMKKKFMPKTLKPAAIMRPTSSRATLMLPRGRQKSPARKSNGPENPSRMKANTMGLIPPRPIWATTLPAPKRTFPMQTEPCARQRFLFGDVESDMCPNQQAEQKRLQMTMGMPRTCKRVFAGCAPGVHCKCV